MSMITTGRKTINMLVKTVDIRVPFKDALLYPDGGIKNKGSLDEISGNSKKREKNPVKSTTYKGLFCVFHQMAGTQGTLQGHPTKCVLEHTQIFTLREQRTLDQYP